MVNPLDIRRFFRMTRKDSPMSDWGHAMFVEAGSPQEAGDIVGSYGKNLYELKPSDRYVDASSLKHDILNEFAKDYRNGTLPESLQASVEDQSFKARSLLDAFDPDDIVNSAGAYDSDDMLPWLWERILDPKGIDGVLTQDGAVSFNRDDIKKLYTKKSPFDEIPDSVKALPFAVGAGGAAAALGGGEAQASVPSRGAVPADMQARWDAYNNMQPEPPLESPVWSPVDLASAPIGASGAAAKAAAMALDPAVSIGADYLGKGIGGLLGLFR